MRDRPPLVVAMPERHSLDDYAEAAAEIESALASLPGARAVYRTGGQSAPGISDIDRIVVVERGAPPASIWEGLSPRTQAIAMHGPFAVDEPTFRRRSWFAHLEPLELVSGARVPASEPDRPGYLATLLAVEGMILSRVRGAKRLATGRIKARSFLCEAYALRYSLELAGMGREDAPRLARLCEEVAGLRSEWSDGLEDAETVRRVRALAQESDPALDEALAALSAPPGAPVTAAPPLDLAPPWGNVRLVPAAPRETRPGAHDRLARRLSSPSHRLSELRWRSRRRALAVPRGALGWLRPPRDPHLREVRAERDRIVRAYEEFMAEAGQGWSQIGFAGSFPTDARGETAL